MILTFLIVAALGIAFITLHLFGAFVIAPFLIPNLRALRYQTLPREMERLIQTITDKSTDEKELLRNVFLMVTDRFAGGSHIQFKAPGKYFQTEVGAVWRQGRREQPCNVLNMIVANALVATGRFQKKDIVLKTTRIRFNIHAYLLVSVGGQRVAVDPWGRSHGVAFGSYAHSRRFGLSLLRKIHV